MKIYKPGEKYKIIRCNDFPALNGKIITVMTYQDDPMKIKVSFDDNWCGYFRPTQLIKI